MNNLAQQHAPVLRIKQPHLKASPYWLLVQFLIQQAFSIQPLLARIPLSEGEIIGFYNAGWISGLRKKVNILKS